jgi:glycosyltransferase involved in cell wall biosynthesis
MNDIALKDVALKDVALKDVPLMREAEASQGAKIIVVILLATYNGARYLPEQLDSIMRQTHRNWILLWRDDGSTDETLTIMRNFAKRAGEARCREAADSGLHLGAGASFLSLLAQTPQSEAIAFADQDDVWMPDKLARALPHFGNARDHAFLYCARQYLVDDQLQGRHLSILPGDRPGFPASLTQNIVHGNTMVMNRRAADLVTRIPGPPGTVHDWWSYIVISACGGTVMIDPQPVVLYRQHEGNLIGSPPSTVARAKAALQRGPGVFMTMMRRHVAQLSFHADYLTEDARADLARIEAGLASYGVRRAWALRCPGFNRQTKLENLLFRLWFMTG